MTQFQINLLARGTIVNNQLCFIHGKEQNMPQNMGLFAEKWIYAYMLTIF